MRKIKVIAMDFIVLLKILVSKLYPKTISHYQSCLLYQSNLVVTFKNPPISNQKTWHDIIFEPKIMVDIGQGGGGTSSSLSLVNSQLV